MSLSHEYRIYSISAFFCLTKNLSVLSFKVLVFRGAAFTFLLSFLGYHKIIQGKPFLIPNIPIYGEGE